MGLSVGMSHLLLIGIMAFLQKAFHMIILLLKLRKIHHLVYSVLLLRFMYHFDKLILNADKQQINFLLHDALHFLLLVN